MAWAYQENARKQTPSISKDHRRTRLRKSEEEGIKYLESNQRAMIQHSLELNNCEDAIDPHS